MTQSKDPKRIKIITLRESDVDRTPERFEMLVKLIEGFVTGSNSHGNIIIIAIHMQVGKSINLPKTTEYVHRLAN